MALSKEDKVEIRVLILKELKNIFGKADKEIATKIEDALHNASADEIALTNPQAGERFRLMKPTF